MGYNKIKDEDGLVRDEKTNAILNVDGSSLAKYKRQREKREQMRQEIEDLKHKMNNIESLLQQLVNRELDK